MRPGLPGKRGYPKLEDDDRQHPIPVPPADGPAASRLYAAGDRHNASDPNFLKARHAGSKVWLDLRGAIRAIRRSSRNSSRGSMTAERSKGESSTQSPSKGKEVGVRNVEAPSPSRKGKGMLAKDLINKLLLANPGAERHYPVHPRTAPAGRGGSLEAAAGTDSAPSSDTGGSQSSFRSSRLSAAGDYSTRKTSVDSRFSILTKNTSSRRNSRRMPWTKSSPESGALGTIDETGMDHVQPTVLTVEKAAAAKIYLETHFNELLNKPNPRHIRQQCLESQLFYSPHLSPGQKNAIRASFYEQETRHLRELRVLKSQSQASGLTQDDNPHLATYEPVQVLGKGSFGVVRLVRERSGPNSASLKQVYAMKVIRKSDMLRSSQEGHLRAERDFLVSSEGSDWVVPLVASFQDAANLYLVMEYMPGGDFLGLLIRENILHESVARFYMAEMIAAVEEAHRLKFIHRDIKPDNFLISASGHLKISDFGLAFDGHWSHDASYYNCHRYSLLRRLGISVDGDETDQKESRNIHTQLKWAQSLMSGLERHERRDASKDDDMHGLLGWRNRCGNRTAANSVVGTSIILYECLYGHTPFLSEEGRQKTKQNILEHKTRFSFPQQPAASEKCKDLIYRLMQEKEHRICSKRYYLKDRGQAGEGLPTDIFGRYVFPDDAEDIKAHRWFSNMPWDRLHTVRPPFVPRIRGAEDTHYFDESEPMEEWSDLHPSEASILAPEDVRNILCDFREIVQTTAIHLIAVPYDSSKLRQIHHQIDELGVISPEEKDVLKQFVRVYGRKERKRPRDRLLRDDNTKDVVMDVRKKTAFMGYTWRRMRPGEYTVPEWV